MNKIFISLVVLLVVNCGFTANVNAAKINIENLEYKPNSKLGGHPGGIFFDRDRDKKYYIKFYPEEMHARTELLAVMIYAIFGITAPKVQLQMMTAPWSTKPELAYISEWDNDLERICPKDNDCTARMREIKNQLARVHLVSAIIKNNDAVPKNILFKDGKVVVVDVGSSFKFGSRDRKYEPQAYEFCSLINKQHDSAKNFRYAFKKYTMKKSAHLINWLDSCWNEHKIKAAISKSGVDDGEMIFTNLKLRFEYVKELLRELPENNTLCQ